MYPATGAQKHWLTCHTIPFTAANCVVAYMRCICTRLRATETNAITLGYMMFWRRQYHANCRTSCLWGISGAFCRPYEHNESRRNAEFACYNKVYCILEVSPSDIIWDSYFSSLWKHNLALIKKRYNAQHWHHCRAVANSNRESGSEFETLVVHGESANCELKKLTLGCLLANGLAAQRKRS